MNSRTFATLYPLYAEFLKLVENTIRQIVRNSHNNESCMYASIPCCRSEPEVCSGETYCLKVSRNGGSKLVKCDECSMELCANGCGRIYHSDYPCELSFDAASDEFIRESSKPCPSCGTNIYKSEGCNHMTCQCHCEFCWICGLELPRDDHGVYRTDFHFSPNRFGIGIVGGCMQYY